MKVTTHTSHLQLFFPLEPFQSSVAFHIKTNHFICNESDFHMKHKAGEMSLAFNFTF